MPWYRLAFHPSVADDLAAIEAPTNQRLFDKTKWIASNIDNLRHETALSGLYKYAVGQWRIFYRVDRAEQIVKIHAIVSQLSLRS